MAVTTSYGIETVRTVAFISDPNTSSADVSSFGNANLGQGGFVAAGNTSSGIAIVHYDATGGVRATAGADAFRDPSVALFVTNTAIVAAENPDTGGLQVFFSAVGSFADGPSLGSGANASVAAAWNNAERAAVAYELDFGGGDSDIRIAFIASDRTVSSQFTIDASSANDRNASVASLRDGGFVVAWDRTDAGGETGIWFATFNGDGSVRTQAREYDGIGAVNRNPSVAASLEGGFTIAYEDSESGASRIALFTESTDGRTRTYTPVASAAGAKDADVTAIGGYSGSIYATAYTQTVPAAGGAVANQDIYVTLSDPDTGKALSGPLKIDVTGNVTGRPSIAQLEESGGQFVVSYTDETAHQVRQQVSRVVETIRGDDAANYITSRTGGRMVVNAGEGNDTVSDSINDDRIFGLGGDDYFYDGRGNDYFDGGAGTDAVFVQSYEPGGVRVDLRIKTAQDTGAGRDTFIGIENLNGSSTQAEVFIGDDNNNVLDSGGRVSGFDTPDDLLIGLGGNDTYIVGRTTDDVREAVNAGVDTVQSYDDFVLSANVENLELLSSAYDSDATGNALANRLTGNAFVNTLDGKAGADVMAGGAGADFYIVDNVGDRVIELNSPEVDRVESTVSFTLGAFVEDLTLAGNAAINGTGNTLGNHIVGNNAANTINGGAGADLMEGGAGSDTYVVENGGDQAIEINDPGVDSVRSTVSFTLGAYVENLTLYGTGAINGFGNELGNRITGNDAANTLGGNGGVDILSGAKGDDIYYVDTPGDRAIELADGGRDTVIASSSYTLADNVENLTLASVGPTNGAGNALANVITGDAFRNVLYGKLGADRLTGGFDADTFVFDTALSSANIDRLLDFSVVDDTIAIENAVFTGLAAGGLSAAAFYVGQAAHDADDRIIYSSALGRLYFDPDGNGEAAAQQFAIIATGLAMTEADFRVL